MARLVLFMIVCLLFMSACGDDEALVQVPVEPEPMPPELSAEIIGAWEITMINNQTPQELADEAATEFSQIVKQNFIDEFGVDSLRTNLLMPLVLI